MRGIKLATMARPRKESEKQKPDEKIRLRPWVERSVFLLAILLLVLLYVGALPGGRRVCVVTVDGEPAAVLATRADAQQVLDRIAGDSGLPAGEVHFAQDVKVEDVSAVRNPIQSYTDALEALRPRLAVVVSAAAILADDRPVVALPDKEAAVQVLSLLLQKLAPPGLSTAAFFKESIRVELQDVPPDLLAPSAEDAAERIASAATAMIEHTVKPGESAWKIARDQHIPLRRLADANPGADLDNLWAGAKLKVPRPAPPITVIARKEIEEQVDEKGYRRTRRVRITYENGAEVKRDVIGGRRPVPLAPPPPRSREPWRWRDEIAE